MDQIKAASPFAMGKKQMKQHINEEEKEDKKQQKHAFKGKSQPTTEPETAFQTNATDDKQISSNAEDDG